MQNAAVQSSRGRPRDASVDAAILTAAFSVLGEVGYGGLTFEAVAQRAGCHRPAVYRRFASKQELVLGLVRSLVRQLDPDPSSQGDPREDLLRHAGNAARFFSDGGGAAVLGLGQARRDDPELARLMDTLYEGETQFYVQALERAAGRALSDATRHLVVDALLGAIVFRVGYRNGVLAPSELEALVDQALRMVCAD
jgi:AcrR family transcriptional regulator